MSPRPLSPPSDQTAAFDQGGCLSGFILPPLAVVCVGALLALVWLGSGPASVSPALAAGVGPGAATLSDNVSALAPSNQAAGGPLSPIFRPEVQYWAGAIQVWAAAAGVDPNLAATVMQIESCGDPFAHSGAGAIGLFQVMPYHFVSSDDPYLPDTNAKRGLAYLKRSLEAAGGDARLALAGYNGGLGLIARPELTWPDETQRYAYWGSGIYTDATNRAVESLRLQEWLETSGASLCRQAHYRLGINP